MGFLSTIRKNALVPATKASNLTAAQVMAAQPGQITPDKSGSWEHLVVPMPGKVQQFNAAQAQALVAKAAQVKAQQAFTTAGYKAIRQISDGFTQANVEHEGARRVLATGAAVSTDAKAHSAAHIQRLRPVYGQAQRKIELFEAAADGAIAAMG